MLPYIPTPQEVDDACSAYNIARIAAHAVSIHADKKTPYLSSLGIKDATVKNKVIKLLQQHGWTVEVKGINDKKTASDGFDTGGKYLSLAAA